MREQVEFVLAGLQSYLLKLFTSVSHGGRMIPSISSGSRKHMWGPRSVNDAWNLCESWPLHVHRVAAHGQ